MVTVLCIQTEEVFVEYIKHKELKILLLATSGEKGISKDNRVLMEEPVHYLVLLLLQFDGTLIKEVLEFTRPMTLMECLDFADGHREAISTHKWLEEDLMKSGWYLHDGTGTYQGSMCVQDPDKL